MSGNLFHERIYLRHQSAQTSSIPSTEEVCSFTTSLLNWLFPELKGRVINDPLELAERYESLRQHLLRILLSMEPNLPMPSEELAASFFRAIPWMDELLSKDAEAILEGDPAATSTYEIIRTYPGFYALAFYRMAHVLYSLGVPLLPRMITEFAHNRTGIDIHPGAQIGAYCCIDHGTGIVIGETTIIGQHVKLYQGVTLGAVSVDKTLAKHKRHPTIEDNVVIYAGATILGGDTVIGHDSVIGGNVWLIKSVAPFSRIYYKAEEHITVADQ